MALNRIACPECGAGLKSATGFTVGKSVRCPKCETAFDVEEPADEEEPVEVKPTVKKKPVKAAAADDDEDDRPKKKPAKATAADDEDRPKKKKKKKKSGGDDEEWSYKNSWMRFGVIGVLVIVLGVLVYLLVIKKQNEANSRLPEPLPTATRVA